MACALASSARRISFSPVAFTDGARLARTPPAHHMTAAPRNINPDDQRDVWVPFHFLPGNEASAAGDSHYGELLKCRKDSEPARAMVLEVLERLPGDTQGLERLGVTAHVYADTFSHFGFSGVSSDRNAVVGSSFRFPKANPETTEYLHGIAKTFFSRFGKEAGMIAAVKSWFAEKATASLGHGSVATYPDLPYLAWGFDYEEPRAKDDRDNHANFLDACEGLFGLFARAVEQRPDFGGGKLRPFSEIRDTVAAILATEGNEDARTNAWKQAAASGKLFHTAENIPDYLGTDWTNWLAGPARSVSSDVALQHPACRFHLAANAHRSWVLHELLPSRNLLVA